MLILKDNIINAKQEKFKSKTLGISLNDGLSLGSFFKQSESKDRNCELNLFSSGGSGDGICGFRIEARACLGIRSKYGAFPSDNS